MEKDDKLFLAKCIAKKSTTHDRRRDTVIYLNHRVNKFYVLSLVNYNLLQRGKKLIRSATICESGRVTLNVSTLSGTSSVSKRKIG